MTKRKTKQEDGRPVTLRNVGQTEIGVARVETTSGPGMAISILAVLDRPGAEALGRSIMAALGSVAGVDNPG